MTRFSVDSLIDHLHTIIVFTFLKTCKNVPFSKLIFRDWGQRWRNETTLMFLFKKGLLKIKTRTECKNLRKNSWMYSNEAVVSPDSIVILLKVNSFIRHITKYLSKARIINRVWRSLNTENSVPSVFTRPLTDCYHCNFWR